MQADERIVNYMKERTDYARTVACVVAVQLFALAVYLCFYALVAGGVFLSRSEGTGKVIVIAISATIAAGLCVVNYLTAIRSKKVYITRPDRTAISDTQEIVRIAYDTARPVLIFKITYCLVMLTLSGVIYITLLIFMEDQSLANIYGRIAVCLIGGVAILIAYPCIDRIACYRALLNETHFLYYDIKPNTPLLYILSFTVPICVCVWYALRYYGSRPDIAWAVFPFVALFALATAFLAKWTGQENGK